MSVNQQTFCMMAVLTPSLMCVCLRVCVCVCADYQSDSDSFNPTLWEEQRQQRMTVAFDFEDKKEEEDNSGKVKVSSYSLLQSVWSCLYVCLSAIAIIMSLRHEFKTRKLLCTWSTNVTSP